MTTNDICPVSGESIKEELINHWTHLIGMMLCLVGVPFLIIYGIMQGDRWHAASFSIYGISLLLLYTASTYYHGCKTVQLKSRLRIVDHICIYLLIAGSYTPFTMGPLRDSNGWILLSIEWGMALIGILFKIFAFNRFQMVSLIVYLVMGWMAVLSWPILTEKLSLTTVLLIASGGISYNIGIIFYVWDSLPYNHGIWHLFVLGGSFCHYCAILTLLTVTI